jgi:glucosylceramidase
LARGATSSINQGARRKPKPAGPMENSMSKRPHTAQGLDRRAVLAAVGSSAAAVALPGLGRAAPLAASTYAVAPNHWVVTTKSDPWRVAREAQVITTRNPGEAVDVDLQPQQRFQTMEGFGACFNEMGWDALNQLSGADREAVFGELFSDQGAGFSLCRMPVGANDFSRDWYSYDETPGDFALADFSIARDETSLLPFIKSAQRVRPDLRLWASPWSPPVWMKTNGHYASAPSPPRMAGKWAQARAGGAGRDRHVRPGRTIFRRLRALLRQVHRRLRQTRREHRHGHAAERIQTPPRFPKLLLDPSGPGAVPPHLGREMDKRGVEIFFGTMERPNTSYSSLSTANAGAGALIRGVGFQWAGKGALPSIAREYPTLRLYQTEQECGDGKNDWRYARYAWSFMPNICGGGCSAYNYRNIALVHGGVSRWGWAQNSLISVDAETRRYRWNHEYYLLKHVAGLCVVARSASPRPAGLVMRTSWPSAMSTGPSRSWPTIRVGTAGDPLWPG